MTEENKSVKNFPNLRFLEFEGGWEIRCLEDFIDVISGIALKSDEIIEFEKGTPILRGINITEGFIRHSKEIDRFYPKTLNEKTEKFILKINDLVIGMDGSKVGKNVALIDEKNIGSILIQRVARIRALNSANIHFIFQKIFSSEFIKYVDLVNTSSGIPHISLQQIKDFKTGFPLNILEQEKIASFLSLLDSRIQTQRKIIEQLETLIKGVSYKLFNKKIRFKNTDLSEFPSWETKKGNEVFSNISNKNHNSELPILAITQEYGAIPRDLIDFKISVSDKSVESYKIVEKGDFIISLRSFQGGIEYSEYKGICSPAYIILRNKIEVNSYFYKYYFKSEYYIKQLNKKLEGIRDGKMISYTYFSDINLPLPSVNEQTKIANFLSSLQEKIETEKQILEKFELHKKFLLTNLFV